MVGDSSGMRRQHKETEMQRTYFLLALAMVLLVMGTASADNGYAINWHTIDSGGNTTPNNSGYSIIGTFGQPDADINVGTPYAMTGGFWNFATYLPTAITLTQSSAGTTHATQLLAGSLLVVLLLTAVVWQRRFLQ